MFFLKWDPPTFSNSIWFIQHTQCHSWRSWRFWKFWIKSKEISKEVLHELLNHVLDFEDQENVPHICNSLLEELILDLVYREERCQWNWANWESSFYAFIEVIHTYFMRFPFIWMNNFNISQSEVMICQWSLYPRWVDFPVRRIVVIFR